MRYVITVVVGIPGESERKNQKIVEREFRRENC